MSGYLLNCILWARLKGFAVTWDRIHHGPREWFTRMAINGVSFVYPDSYTDDKIQSTFLSHVKSAQSSSGAGKR